MVINGPITLFCGVMAPAPSKGEVGIWEERIYGPAKVEVLRGLSWEWGHGVMQATL